MYVYMHIYMNRERDTHTHTARERERKETEKETNIEREIRKAGKSKICRANPSWKAIRQGNCLLPGWGRGQAFVLFNRLYEAYPLTEGKLLYSGHWFKYHSHLKASLEKKPEKRLTKYLSNLFQSSWPIKNIKNSFQHMDKLYKESRAGNRLISRIFHCDQYGRIYR